MSEEIKNPAEDVKETGNEKMFSENEMNERIQRAVQDRLKREQKKYEGFDDLKSELEELRNFKSKAEEKDMSEMEKLQKQIEEISREKEELNQNYLSTKTEWQKERLNSQFKDLARENNIKYVEDALKLVSDDLAKLEPDESGKYSGLDDLVKGLAESKPFLIGKKEEPKSIGSPSNPKKDHTVQSNEERLKEARDKFKNSNSQEDQVAYIRLKRELGL